MRKYLISGALALIAGGFAASCSDNDIDYTSTVDQKVKAFEQVFKEAFGEIDPNQRWGFEEEDDIDNDINAARRAKAKTRAITSSHKFSKDADVSKFLSEVPGGVEMGGSFESGIAYIDETYTGEVNIWGHWDGQKTSGGTLYIRGNCDFSNRKFYIVSNTEVYLIAGATLTLSEAAAAEIQGGCNYYIADGAKIVTSGSITLNSGAHWYNHGTIQAGKLEVNGSSLLYNSATVRVTGDLSSENNDSEIVNDGNLTVGGNLSTRGSSHFQNNSKDCVISGNTYINSNFNTWVNNGTYKTNIFEFTAGSSNVINNCRLLVDDYFYVNNGDNPGNSSFQQDKDGYTKTKNFYGGGSGGGPFYIILGQNSLFEVTETAEMHATKADYGIYGPSTGDFAMFKAKNITKGATNQGFEVTYGAKLNIVATDSHFAQGNDGAADHPYYAFKDGCSESNVYVAGSNNGGSCTPCTPSSSCILGVSTPVRVSDEKEYDTEVLIETGRVFAEDLGKATREDLDYNDVVFDAEVWKIDKYKSVTWKVDGVQQGDPEITHLGTTYKNKITLLAAGGTYPLTVDGHEVHALFGVGTTTIVNTRDNNSTAYGSFTTKNPVELWLTNKYQKISDIPVVVNYGGDGSVYGSQTKELKAEQGKAPQKIFIPNATPSWMVERKIITQGYPGFKAWVNNGTPEFWKGTNDPYYLYSLTHGVTNDPKGTVVNVVQSSTSTSEAVLWSGSETYGSWTNKTFSLNSQIYYAGDRIRFYGTTNADDYKDTLEPPYITVVYSDGSTPYFLDSKFPTSGCIEVVLDETAAQKLTSGSISIQGRKFTLTSITINRW